MSSDGSTPDPVAQAWSRLEAQWEDADAHESFVNLCVSLDRLADAGTCYRDLTGVEDPRHAMATSQISRIQAIAILRLQSAHNANGRADTIRRSLFWLALLIALGLIVTSAWAFLQMS